MTVRLFSPVGSRSRVAIGIVLVATGQTAVGASLVLTGAGSMAAAALVLFASSPDKHAAALKQGAMPLLGGRP